jgi:hypothetical protein
VYTTPTWVRCTPPQPIRKNRGFRVYHGFLFALNETRDGKTMRSAENYLARTGYVVSSGYFRTPLGQVCVRRNEGNHRAIESLEDANEVEPSRMSRVPHSEFASGNAPKLFAHLCAGSGHSPYNVLGIALLGPWSIARASTEGFKTDGRN